MRTQEQRDRYTQNQREKREAERKKKEKEKERKEKDAKRKRESRAAAKKAMQPTNGANKAEPKRRRRVPIVTPEQLSAAIASRIREHNIALAAEAGRTAAEEARRDAEANRKAAEANRVENARYERSAEAVLRGVIGIPAAGDTYPDPISILAESPVVENTKMPARQLSEQAPQPPAPKPAGLTEDSNNKRASASSPWPTANLGRSKSGLATMKMPASQLEPKHPAGLVKDSNETRVQPPKPPAELVVDSNSKERSSAPPAPAANLGRGSQLGTKLPAQQLQPSKPQAGMFVDLTAEKRASAQSVPAANLGQSNGGHSSTKVSAPQTQPLEPNNKKRASASTLPDAAGHPQPSGSPAGLVGVSNSKKLAPASSEPKDACSGMSKAGRVSKKLPARQTQPSEPPVGSVENSSGKSFASASSEPAAPAGKLNGGAASTKMSAPQLHSPEPPAGLAKSSTSKKRAFASTVSSPAGDPHPPARPSKKLALASSESEPAARVGDSDDGIVSTKMPARQLQPPVPLGGQADALNNKKRAPSSSSGQGARFEESVMPDAQGQPPERPVGPVEDSDMQMSASASPGIVARLGQSIGGLLLLSSVCNDPSDTEKRK